MGLITEKVKSNILGKTMNLLVYCPDGYEKADLVIPEFTQGAEQAQEYAQIVLTVGAHVVLRTGEVFCEEPILPDVLTDSPEQEAVAWIRSR